MSIVYCCNSIGVVNIDRQAAMPLVFENDEPNTRLSEPCGLTVGKTDLT